MLGGFWRYGWGGVRLTYPLAFDDSITFLQKLQRLQAYINTIIEELEELKNGNKDYIDNEIKKVLEIIYQVKRELELKIIALETKHDQDIKELYEFIDESVDKIRAEIDAKFAVINSDIDKRFADILARIDSILEYSLIVLDPYTGRDNTLNGAFRNVYRMFNQLYGITCNAVKQLNMTCSEWTAQSVLCRDIAFIAKKFRKFNKEIWNPVSGVFGPVQDALNSLMNLHTNQYTCTQVEELYLECSGIAALNKTCWEWAYQPPSGDVTDISNRLEAVIKAFEDVEATIPPEGG